MKNSTTSWVAACGLLLAACTFNQVSPDRIAPIAEYRSLLDGTVRPDMEVIAFGRSDELFPVRVVRKGPALVPLRQSSRPLMPIKFQSDGKNYDLFDYLSLNRVAGLLVLKDGEISFEDYELGIDSSTRWASFSVAKSITSTLVGAAIKDGYIKSLDEPLTQYLPQLRNTAYDGVSIRHVLQMSSGVRWNEAYTDRNSDLRKLSDKRMTLMPGTIVDYMSTLSRAAEPGSVFAYNTGETYLLGPLLEAATHRPLAQYLSERIWSRVGADRDATWWLESPEGVGLAGAGFGATLRDYGRFGLLVLNDGVIDGERIVPEGWFSVAGSAKVVGGKPVDYGYMWWPMPKGDEIHAGAFRAIGIFGQYIYINPAEKLVIVVVSARPKPTGGVVIKDNDFFGAVARALH